MSELALSAGSLVAGRYRLDRHLGEGGMGTVWAAQHTVTRRLVAMKFLRDAMRARGDIRQRFLREAATASSLKHPNVVEIIDVFDLEDSTPVMVMELLEGETLGKKLARDERLSIEETAAIMLPVVSAVGTAHARGIIHRDLKPENLFLERSATAFRAKVLDFGIAKLTAERYLEHGHSALLTETGSLLGTPCYMAPEQASGEHPIDQRADIWSLGVILYECLSGTRPIEGENLAQVVTRLMSAGIMPLDRLAPGLPPEITALVTQMLARDPVRRPENLLDVGRVLARYTHVRPPAFDPPSIHERSAPAAPPTTPGQVPPRAAVVHSGGVDPQGATLLSSPAVGNSVAIPQPRNKNRSLAFMLGALSLLGAGVWLGGALSNGAAEPPAPPAGATLAPVNATFAIDAPSTTHATSAPEAPPTPLPAVASSAPKSSAAAPKASPRPRTEAPASRAKRAKVDDETLFSGRK